MRPRPARPAAVSAPQRSARRSQGTRQRPWRRCDGPWRAVLAPESCPVPPLAPPLLICTSDSHWRSGGPLQPFRIARQLLYHMQSIYTRCDTIPHKREQVLAYCMYEFLRSWWKVPEHARPGSRTGESDTLFVALLVQSLHGNSHRLAHISYCLSYTSDAADE